MTPRGDRARVTITVHVPVEAAFNVFTQEIDLWWKRGPRYRPGGKRIGKLSFEPGPGGRLFESYSDDPATPFIEMGRIHVWDPPSRLVFEWRNKTFSPEESTEVEVTFAPVSGGTVVTVEHRGWSSIRPDHPARHGMAPSEFIASVGTFWGDLMGSLRERAEPEERDSEG